MPAGDPAWEALIPESPQVLEEAAHSRSLTGFTGSLFPLFQRQEMPFARQPSCTCSSRASTTQPPALWMLGMPTKKQIRKVRQRSPAAAGCGIAPSQTLAAGTAAFLLLQEALWDDAGGQRYPGVLSWCLLGFGMLQGVGTFGSFHPGLAWLQAVTGLAVGALQCPRGFPQSRPLSG